MLLHQHVEYKLIRRRRAGLHQLAVQLDRLSSSRTAFSTGGYDSAVLRLDRAALGVRETQGQPKGIGHRKRIAERSQEPVLPGSIHSRMDGRSPQTGMAPAAMASRRLFGVPS